MNNFDSWLKDAKGPLRTENEAQARLQSINSRESSLVETHFLVLKELSPMFKGGYKFSGLG